MVQKDRGQRHRQAQKANTYPCNRCTPASAPFPTFSERRGRVRCLPAPDAVRGVTVAHDSFSAQPLTSADSEAMLALSKGAGACLAVSSMIGIIGIRGTSPVFPSWYVPGFPGFSASPVFLDKSLWVLPASPVLSLSAIAAHEPVRRSGPCSSAETVVPRKHQGSARHPSAPHLTKH